MLRFLQMTKAGHGAQNPRLRVDDCCRDSTAAVQSIPATSGRRAMSSSTYKHTELPGAIVAGRLAHPFS